MKCLRLIVSFISVLTVNCTNEPYRSEDPVDGPVDGVYADDLAARLLTQKDLVDPDEHLNTYSPGWDEQLNEEENGPNGVELRNSPNTTCKMNGGACISKKSMKNCQGTINTEYKCTKKDVCCMPGAMEIMLKRLLSTFPSVMGTLLQSIKDNQQSLKDDLAIVMSNMTNLGPIETKLNNLTAQLNSLRAKQYVMEDNQETLMKTVTQIVCPKGFFKLASSDQCFKIYMDKTRSWHQANATCRAEGLVMGKPTDPVALRNYLNINYGYNSTGGGWPFVWLPAQGTGSYFYWQPNGGRLTASSPLWYSGYPGSYTSSSYCLLMLTEDGHWNNYPQQPYARYSCSSSNWVYALCELLKE